MSTIIIYNDRTRAVSDELFRTDALLDDLRVLSVSPTSEIDALAKALDSAPGFVDTKDIVEITGRVVLDPNHRESIARILQNVTDIRDSIQQDNFDTFFSGKVATISGEELGEVVTKAALERLQILLAEFPAIQRQKKAERLLRASGRRLDDSAIFCDLRPVFDKSGEKIEGMIPMGTLRLQISCENRLPEIVELSLSTSDLDSLIAIATRAKLKLDQLRAHLDATSMPAPKV